MTETTETTAPRRSSLRGAATLSAAQLAYVASGYALNFVLARVLGPGSYGVFAIVINLLTVVNLMQTQGVPQSLSRALAGGTPEGAVWRTAIRIQTFASAAGMALLALSAPILASVLDDDRLLQGLLIATLAVPGYAAFSTLGGYLNGRRDFARQASLMGAYAGARVVFVVGLALAFHQTGAIAGFAISPLIAFAFLAGARPGGRSGSSAQWWPIVRFALPSIGLALALTSTMSADLLFVKGMIAGDIPAGLYAAAQNAARVTYFLMIPAGVVLFPAIAEAMASDNRDRQHRLVRDGIEGAVAVVIGIVAIVTAAREPLLALVFGPRYIGASEELALLAPAFGLLALAYTLSSIVAGAGRPIGPMIVAAAAAGVQLAVELPLTRAHGVVGAATGTLIASGLCLTGQAWLVWRRVGVLVDWTRVVRAIAAGAVAYLIAAQASTRVVVVPIGAAAAIAYVLVLVALRAVPRRLARR